MSNGGHIEGVNWYCMAVLIMKQLIEATGNDSLVLPFKHMSQLSDVKIDKEIIIQYTSIGATLSLRPITSLSPVNQMRAGLKSPRHVGPQADLWEAINLLHDRVMKLEATSDVDPAQVKFEFGGQDLTDFTNTVKWPEVQEGDLIAVGGTVSRVGPQTPELQRGLTTDRNDPALKVTMPDGQQQKYLVLSAEERAKGFCRPVRRLYKHVGVWPEYELRDLTAEELEQYATYGYVKFEAYPKSESSVTGRFWTQDQLDAKTCNATTTMNIDLAETYARNPKFYGSTYCCACNKHFSVEQFVWLDSYEKVGS